MTEKEFVAGLSKDPTDRRLRSGYAEWLSRQGDPRGEFLRLEEQHEALPYASSEAELLREQMAELGQSIPHRWFKSIGRHASWHGDDEAADALLERASSFVEREKFEQAVKTLAPLRSVVGMPGDLAGYLHSQLADCLQTLGRIDEAAAERETVIHTPGVTDDSLGAALCQRGEQRSEQGDTAGAISDYTAALRLPELPVAMRLDALCSRGGAFVALKQHGLGFDDYAAVLEDPDAADEEFGEYRAHALLERGFAYLDLGQFDESFDDATHMLSLEVGNADQNCLAYYCRGLARFRQNRHAEAVEELTAALECDDVEDSIRSMCRTMRGVALAGHGRLDEALEDFEDALEGELDEAMRFEALLGVGDVYFQQEKFELAHANFNHVLQSFKLSPEERARALLARGLAYEHERELDRAEEDYTAATGLEGADADTRGLGWNNLGTVRFLQGRYAESCDMVRKAMEVDPKAGWPHMNLGHALLFLHRPDEALAAYDQGLSMVDDLEFLTGSLDELNEAAAKEGRPAGFEQAIDKIQTCMAKLRP